MAKISDQFGRNQLTERGTVRFRKMGEMIGEFNQPINYLIEAGYTLKFDIWSNKALKQDDQIKLRASYKFGDLDSQ